MNALNRQQDDRKLTALANSNMIMQTLKHDS